MSELEMTPVKIAFEKCYPQSIIMRDGDDYKGPLQHDWIIYNRGWDDSNAWNRRAADDWRPIETAPTAEKLLLWSPQTHTYSFIGRHWEQDNVWRDDEDNSACFPTHWLPLPDPPRKDDGHEITDEEGGGVR